jgi:oxygen-independent coproporphyrinogen III oxidase
MPDASVDHRNMSLGLYLHIPFCRSICHYCNFGRVPLEPSLKRRYVPALASEVRRAAEQPRAAADTVYLGGGTPSLLEPAEVTELLGACRESFDLAADAEITLEANPESLDAERLLAFRRAGVNRLSCGVQSFDDDELWRLGRVHRAGDVYRVFALARSAGFDNVSLDLIMGLPGQRLDAWMASVEALIELGPEHASLYLLDLSPGAPLQALMSREGWLLPPDEIAADMYREAMARLELAGYRQYEISNVARRGRQSRHNLKYWTDGEWLGFGCGAHSTRNGVRWKNVPGPSAYVERLASGAGAAVDRHVLSPAERVGDAAFTRLRLTDGLDLDAFVGRYGADIWRMHGEELEPYVRAGLLRRGNGRLRLTRRGMLLSNEVMAVFV